MHYAQYPRHMYTHKHTVWMNNQTDTGLSLCFPSHIKLHECRPTHCRLHFPLCAVKTTHQPLSPLVYQPLSISCYLYLCLTLSFLKCESRRIVQQINKTTVPVIRQHTDTLSHSDIVVIVTSLYPYQQGKPFTLQHLHAFTACYLQCLMCVLTHLLCVRVCVPALFQLDR